MRVGLADMLHRLRRLCLEMCYTYKIWAKGLFVPCLSLSPVEQTVVGILNKSRHDCITGHADPCNTTEFQLL